MKENDSILIKNFGDIKEIEITKLPKILVITGENSDLPDLVLNVLTYGRYIINQFIGNSKLFPSVSDNIDSINCSLVKEKSMFIKSMFRSNTTIKCVSNDIILELYMDSSRTIRYKLLQFGDNLSKPNAQLVIDKIKKVRTLLRYYPIERAIFCSSKEISKFETNKIGYKLYQGFIKNIVETLDSSSLGYILDKIRPIFGCDIVFDGELDLRNKNTLRKYLPNSYRSVLMLLLCIEITRLGENGILLKKLDEYESSDLVSIVEQIELLLSPKEQIELLEYLIDCTNDSDNVGNLNLRFWFSTQSLYIINYLNILINDPKYSIDVSEIGVYYILDGYLEDLVHTDGFIIDTRNFSDPISDIYDRLNQIKK